MFSARIHCSLALLRSNLAVRLWTRDANLAVKLPLKLLPLAQEFVCQSSRILEAHLPPLELELDTGFVNRDAASRSTPHPVSEAAPEIADGHLFRVSIHSAVRAECGVRDAKIAGQICAHGKRHCISNEIARAPKSATLSEAEAFTL